MIICPICNKKMSYINNSHLKKHQLTPLQFKDKYPNFNNISHTARKLMGGDKTNAVIANKKKAMEIKESEKEKFLLSNKCCLNCNTPITFEKNIINFVINHALLLIITRIE